MIQPKLILFILVALVSWIGTSQAQSPRQQLRQMVEELQKTPTDDAMRERIINLAVKIKPAPAIPKEADLAFVNGNAFLKEAKNATGYELAISAYWDALRHAPWWADAYYNLSVAQESVGKFEEAVASMKFYQFAVLPGTDSGASRSRITALEAKRNMTKTRSFEGYWRQEEFKDFDSKQWINKDILPDSTNTIVWSIRKGSGGSYIVNTPQADVPDYESVVATEQTIEWWNPSGDPKEDCESSSCGVKMNCRRTDAQGMECLFQGIGWKDIPGYRDISSLMRLRRFDRCVRIGGENEGNYALRCE
jgi:tetratricopeptide (TPR) repeat protein